MYQNHTLPIRSIKEDLPSVQHLLEICIDIQTIKYADVLIATTEALTNALTHGNKENPSKKVFLTLRYETNPKTVKEQIVNILTVIVTDEGAPFNPSSIPNPTDENNIHKEGGRGLLLMEKLSDTILFDHTGKGNKITMIFHIPVGVESEV